MAKRKWTKGQTRTPLKAGDELRCSRRVNIPFSTCGTRRITIITNPVIRHEIGKDQELLK